jgi:hypothetical protein
MSLRSRRTNGLADGATGRALLLAGSWEHMNLTVVSSVDIGCLLQRKIIHSAGSSMTDGL